LLQLTEWAQAREPNDFLSVVPCATDMAQKWGPEMVPRPLADAIKAALENRQRIAVQVPLTVETKAEGRSQTHFNIFLESAPDHGRIRPAFIRDELIISDVRGAPWNQNIRALVIIEDPPIANLLRDAETPAHTQWNASTGNFKNKYTNGPSVIKFVSQSASELLRIIREAEQEPDPTITLDFFSLPPDPSDPNPQPTTRPRPQPGQGPNPPGTPPKPPGPRHRPFMIEKVSGGFTVRSQLSASGLPHSLDIRMAYDVRRGSPLKRYNEADFQVNLPPIRIQHMASNVKEASGNHLIVELLGPEFRVEVSGFDTERELFVKVIAVEANHD
jgi:hypothetical protein